MALHPKYGDTINRAAQWAAGIGVPGSIFPPLDITAMSIIWMQMTRNIAKISGHKVGWTFALKLIYSIFAGSMLYVGGSKLVNALLHAIPGAGTVTAAGANAIFNYIYTVRLGNILVAQFSRPDIDQASLLSMTKTIATAVFLNVTADEVADAQAHIGDHIEHATSSDTLSQPDHSFAGIDAFDQTSIHPSSEASNFDYVANHVVETDVNVPIATHAVNTPEVHFRGGCDCGYNPNNCGAGHFCRWQH